MKYIFIGLFPPPYGGVTKKNVMLFDALKDRIDLERTSSIGKTALIEQVLKILKHGNGYVLGIGSMKRLKQYLFFMNTLNPKALSNTIVMVPGGVFHQYVKDAGSKYIDILKKTKVLYVETRGMQEALEEIGVTNSRVFPNCRNESPSYEPRNNRSDKLRCLFFSMISDGKGIDAFLGAARKKPEMQFDIYGELNMSKQESDGFIRNCESIENVQYMGCFKGSETEVFDLLNGYDVLILPSRWRFEGVPGVLVEAKIAALPAIVSSINFNAEVVQNGIEGIVLQENTVECLCKNLAKLDEDRELLFRLASGAKQSARRYELSSYIEELVASFR